jgi:hypothetical protein
MKLNQTLTTVEKGFNIAGSVPVVGIFSGALRTKLSLVQVISGLAIGIIGFVGKLFSNQEKWESLRNAGVEHLVHGALNWVRGNVEVLAGITIVGSLALGAFQLWGREASKNGNGFSPLISYNGVSKA